MTQQITTLSGTIEATARGPLLHGDDGLCWRIRTGETLQSTPTSATVRGRLIDPGTIEAEHIEPRAIAASVPDDR